MATYYSPYDGRNYRLRLEVNQVSQSIENNTSSITYALYLENGWYTFASFQSTGSLVINGVTEWSLAGAYSSATSFNSDKLIKSGTMTIPHNSDGTKTLSFNASFKTNNVGDFGTTKTLVISDSLVLTTIPRASTITITHSSRALGETQTLTITRASTSFTHTLRYRVGTGAWVSLASSIATSYNWTLADAIANSMPTLSGTITVECTTYNGSTQIGSPTTTTFTVTIPNTSTFRPNASISNTTVIDGLGGLFVQSKSRIRVQSSGSGKFGAGITQYRVIIDGSTLYGTDVTSAVINKSGTISIALRVTDTRGLFTDVSTSVTFQIYFPPKINSFTATRSPTDQDTNLSAPVNFEIASVGNQNSRYYRVRYRVAGGSWVLLFESSSYYSRIFTHTGSGVLNTNKSYEVEMYVQDSYSSASQVVNISTAFQLINWNQSGQGIAFGKVSEGDVFDVALPGRFRNGLSSDGGGDVPPVSTIYNVTSGVLIDICDATLFNMITVSVIGNGYTGWPINTIFQTYHYNSVGHFLESRQTNYSGDLPAGKFLIDGGRIKLWFAAHGMFKTYIITAYGMNGVIYKTNVINSTEPSSSYVSTCLRGGVRSDIVESGSNTNGRYVKYADGTQICYIHSKSIPFISSTRFAGNMTIPATFISTEYAILAIARNGAGFNNQVYGVYASPNSAIDFAINIYGSNFINSPAFVSFILIGRWF